MSNTSRKIGDFLRPKESMTKVTIRVPTEDVDALMNAVNGDGRRRTVAEVIAAVVRLMADEARAEENQNSEEQEI